MPDHASSSSHSISPAKARIARARSLPSARPFRVAVFFSSVHYLGLIATATALACFFHQPSEEAMRIFVGGLIFSAISWLIAFFKRRSAYCPLCKGTPMVNSGAHVHVRARRLLPFNHGVTATLAILTTQKFRCMYCGSDFDLLKPRTRILYGDAEEPEGEDASVQDIPR
jgi:hypothetical protein